VNDGSTDNTLASIRQASTHHLEKITVINLTRNFGAQPALMCLINHASSPVNILMDADFQDNPDLIPELIQRYEQTGAGLVRVARAGQAGSWLVRGLFFGFRRLFRLMTGQRYDFGTFGLYSQRALQALRAYSPEVHFFLPGHVNFIGMKTIILQAPRAARREGSSKMGFRRLFGLAFDAFFSFSAFPIRLASLLGFFITSIAAIAIVVIIYVRLFTSLAIPGWSSILTAVTFFGGVQLVFLGIVGEYIARIFEQVKQRPSYFIDSTVVIERSSHASATP
jgi:dolichol-phosphate mannosyltransferase